MKSLFLLSFLVLLSTMKLDAQRNRGIKEDKFLFVNIGGFFQRGEMANDRFGGIYQKPHIVSPIYVGIEKMKISIYKKDPGHRSNNTIGKVTIRGHELNFYTGKASNKRFEIAGEQLPFFQGFDDRITSINYTYKIGRALIKKNKSKLYYTINFGAKTEIYKTQEIPTQINILTGIPGTPLKFTEVGAGLNFELFYLLRYKKNSFIKFNLELGQAGLYFQKKVIEDPLLPIQFQKSNSFVTNLTPRTILFKVGVPIWKKVKSRKSKRKRK